MYIKGEDIRYGSVSLLDIFDRKHENVAQQPVYISMKAGRVVRPSVPIYLVFRGGSKIESPGAINIYLGNTNQAKCSLKQYFDLGGPDYDLLLDIINNKDIWQIDTTRIGKIAQPETNSQETFWDICSIGDYELAWSNALAYYIHKYPELPVEFVKEKYGREISPFGIIERERDNIDILLENDEELVIIENKITSKINGIQVKNDELIGTQLIKYHRKALQRLCGISKDIVQHKEWVDCMERCPKRIRCYILTPNYNQINLDDYNTPHEPGNPSSPLFVCKDFYTQITYGDLYEFLKGRHTEDFYFNETLKAMKKHVREFHDDLFEETRKKFLNQIAAFA